MPLHNPYDGEVVHNPEASRFSGLRLWRIQIGVFVISGLTAGLALLSDWVKRHEAAAFAASGIGGTALILVARWLDHQPRQLYAVYSFWTTSPNFFLLRVGLLLVILFAVYAWCRWGASP